VGKCRPGHEFHERHPDAVGFQEALDRRPRHPGSHIEDHDLVVRSPDGGPQCSFVIDAVDVWLEPTGAQRIADLATRDDPRLDEEYAKWLAGHMRQICSINAMRRCVTGARERWRTPMI
jgi:hypothetical protein